MGTSGIVKDVQKIALKYKPFINTDVKRIFSPIKRRKFHPKSQQESLQ